MKLFKDALIYDGTGADAFKGDILLDGDVLDTEAIRHSGRAKRS